MLKLGKRRDVGYGRPPADKQFKPGKSGNRKGRPKGTKGSFQKFLHEELNSVRTVRHGEETLALTGWELLAKRFYIKATEGSPRHLELLMRLDERWQAMHPPAPKAKTENKIAGIIDLRIAQFLPPELFSPFMATLTFMYDIAASQGFKQMTTEGLEIPLVIQEEMNEGFHRGLQRYEKSAAARQPNAWRFPWEKLRKIMPEGDGER